MRPLERDYIFEFAGMPQSGKTVVKEILAHYLKRMEYPVVEFNGGSRSSGLSIYRWSIGKLNDELAQRIEKFVRPLVKGQNAEHNIYLLDRGLIDRCIFTDALERDKKVFPEQARKIYESLTIPEFLERLDGVFIFVTSPETALAREYADKLVRREDVRFQGDVMNEQFLREMHLAAEKWFKEVSNRNYPVRYIERIDTTAINTDMQKVAERVFEGIREQYPELEFQLTFTR